MHTMRHDFAESLRSSQTEEVGLSKVPVVTEAQFSLLRRPDAVEYKGRFWRPADASKGLIFIPVNPLAVIKPEEAGFPVAASLGYRATVDGIEPNAVSYLHIMRDLESFSIDKIPNKYMRRDLRAVIRDPNVSVFRPTPENPGLLVEQGAQLHASSSAVQEYSPFGRHTRQAFEAGLETSGFNSGNLLILAGLVEGNLAGYVTGLAVDNTAIAEMLVVGDSYKSTNVGTRLMYAFIEACQRTEGIDQIYNWRVEPSKPGISQYKERLGFSATEVPATVVLRPGINSLFQFAVRKVRPEVYKRLYGQY